MSRRRRRRKSSRNRGSDGRNAERNQHLQHLADQAPPRAVNFMTQLLASLPQTMGMVDMDVPDMKAELLRSRFRDRLLSQAYALVQDFLILQRALPMQLAFVDRPEADNDSGSFFKRWGPPTEELGEFLRTARPNSLFKNRPYGEDGYFSLTTFVGSKSVRVRHKLRPEQDFSHCVQPRRQFEFGRVHVGVAFVDLSMLLDARIRGNARRDGPFVFVGMEASKVCVAKTKILVTLMRHFPSVSPHALLELWFSSAWSQETLELFEASARRVLTDDSSIATAIREVISVWIEKCAHPLSVRRSQEVWIEYTSTLLLGTADNALRVRDRVDLAYYLLTGELFPSREKVCGSVSMFCRPETCGVMPMNQSFFECVRLDGIDVSSHPVLADAPLVDLIMQHLLKCVERLRGWILRGEVVCAIHLKEIRLSEASTLAKIRAMNPYTMSWSNLQDYCSRDYFRNLTRSCSGPETLHFSHSVNWIQNVYGTDLHDFPAGSRRKIYDQLVGTWKQAMRAYTSTDSHPTGRAAIMSAYFQEDIRTHYRNLFTARAHLSVAKEWFDWYLEGYATSNWFPLSTFFSIFDHCHCAVTVAFSHSALRLRGVSQDPTGESHPDERFGRRCMNPSCSCDLTGERKRLCSGCRCIRYCSKDCQRQHWRIHKPRCLEIRALAQKVATIAEEGFS